MKSMSKTNKNLNFTIENFIIGGTIIVGAVSFNLMLLAFDRENKADRANKEKADAAAAVDILKAFASNKTEVIVAGKHFELLLDNKTDNCMKIGAHLITSRHLNDDSVAVVEPKAAYTVRTGSLCSIAGPA